MLAIFEQEQGKRVIETIPAGAVLRDSSEPSTTLLGLVGVYWQGRHYSVSFGDLAKKESPMRQKRLIQPDVL